MADYNYDIQKLYLEMFLADAESFVRVQNIFQYESFDRKLQPVAKYLKEYVDKYKVMPELRIVKAETSVDLQDATDVPKDNYEWLLDEFEKFINILEAKYLDEQTKETDVKYRKELKKIIDECQRNYEANKKKLLGELTRLKEIYE